MKQTRTTLKELTAAYRAVLRHGILCNAIALGLIVAPAMAEPITETVNNGTEQIHFFNVQNGSYEITNSHYTGNENVDKNGIVAWLTSPGTGLAGSSLTVSNSEFVGNVSSIGGALGAGTRGGTLTVSGSTFDGNHSILDGGAIGNYAGLNISGSTFKNNTAQYAKNTETGKYDVATEDGIPVGGGAIALGAVSSTSIGSITDTTFQGNKSGRNGGAIGTRLGSDADNRAAKLDIEATFIGNEAHENGGAIYNTFYANNGLDKGDGVTVSGTFTGNKAANGGAIYNDGALDQANNHGGVMTVTGATFTNNSATVDGGAIYNNGTLTLNGNTEFSNNTSGNGAGAIYNEGNLTLNGVRDGDNYSINLNNNTANGVYSGSNKIGGGAIFANRADSLTTIKGTKFSQNHANSAIGGAMYLFSGTAEITNSEFSENTAAYGGAIYTQARINNVLNTSDLTITNSEFNSNTAKGVGAIGIMRKGIITDTDFTGNQATDATDDGAGALFLGAESYTTLTRGTFEDNTSAAAGGAIGTRDFVQGNNVAAKLDINGTTFNHNTAATTGGAIDNYFYNDAAGDGYVSVTNATFTENEAAKGGAIYNHKNATQTGNMYLADSTFTGNTASANGGAIYNEGIVTIAAKNEDVAFTGNTANGSANDIYNVGTLNLNAASGRTISLAGGIDGAAGTLNIVGNGLVETSTIKNQTVAHNAGELHLTTTEVDGANLTGSTVNVASGATINTIDNLINNYKDGGAGKGTITLSDGANIKGDIDFENAVADMYAADTDATVNYRVGNLLGSIGKGTKEIQVVSSGAMVDISEAHFTSENGASFVSSGTNDGKMKVQGFEGGIADAADASATVDNVMYQLTENESLTTDKTLQNEFVLTGAGTEAADEGLELAANLQAAEGATVEINDLKLSGSGKLVNNGFMRINDSFVDVDVDTSGVFLSDPTTYTGTVTNTGFASFDQDTFTSTAKLNNSANVSLANGVTFDTDATIIGEGTTNLVGGIVHFNDTANDNTINVASGANFDGKIIGGSINTQNGMIDTIAGSIQGMDVAMDVNTTSGATDSFAGVTGSTIKSLNVSGAYGTDDSVDVTIGSGLTLAGDAEINGGYYTKVEQSGSKLTFSDKLINESALYTKLGAWSAGNYIKANVDMTHSGSDYMTVGGALTALDTAIGDMSGFGSQNYAKNTTNVAANITALDTQLKTVSTEGTIASGNTGFVSGGAVYTALADKVDTTRKINGHALNADVTLAAADVLTTDQLAAANSGVTATKVSDYDTHIADTDIHVTASEKTTWSGKQDAITSGAKLNADLVDDSASTNKFVTAAEKTTWSGKQDALTSVQLAAANSGITSTKVGTYDDVAAAVNHATTGLAATKAIADQNKTDIATINSSNVMTSGITATKVGTYDDVAAAVNHATTGLAATKAIADANAAAIATHGNIVTHNVAEFATSGQGAKADTAIQGVQVNGADLTPDASNIVNVTVTTGTANGTIKVNGADVAVAGLNSAAYEAATAFDAAGSAAAVDAKLGTGFSSTDTVAAALALKADSTDLGTAAGKNVAAAFTGSTEADIAAWGLANTGTIADVDTTFAVLTAKLNNVENDLLNGDGSNTHSIAHALGATGSTTLTEQVETLAKASAAAGAYDNTTSGLTATTIQGAIDENAAAIATKQGAITNTSTIAVDGTGLSVVDGSIGTTQLSTAVNTSLGLANSAIQGVKVNGSALTPDSDKVVNVTVASGSANGTIAVNGTDVAVTGFVETANAGALSADIATIMGGSGEAKDKRTALAGLLTTGTYADQNLTSASIAEAVGTYMQLTADVMSEYDFGWDLNAGLQHDKVGGKYKIDVLNDTGVTDITVAGAINANTAAMTVAADGNYITAGHDVAGNLGALDTQAKANADDIDALETATTVTADGNYILAANDVKDNLGALDAGIGAKIAADGNYIKASSTNSVNQNISALDTQAKANADGIADIVSGATIVAKAYGDEDGNNIKATYATKTEVTTGVTAVYNQAHDWAENLLGLDVDEGVGNQLQHGLAALGGTNNIDATTITGALHELDTEKAGLDLDNTFTGENTFQNANGINIANAGGTITANMKAGTYDGHDVLAISGVDGVTAGGFGATGDGFMTEHFTANDTEIELTNSSDAVMFSVDNSGDMTVAGDVSVGGDLDVTGGISAATLATTGDASVGGDLAVTGDISGATLTTTGDATIGGDLDVTGDATIGGDLAVTGDISGATLTTTGDATIGGDLDVTGDASVGGDLAVTGDISGATLTTTGDATIGGDLAVTGDISGATLTTTGDANVGGDLDVTGDASVGGDLAVTGDISGATLTTTGDANVGGDLDVTGDFAVNTNKFTVAAASGNTSVGGTLNVAGNTTLNGSLKFTGAETVDAIDDGTTAQTTGGANTLSTVATVLKSAENADFTGTQVNGATGAITINGALSATNAAIGDMNGLTGKYVTPGATIAANLDQLSNAVDGAYKYTDQRVESLDKEMSAGVAGAVALSSVAVSGVERGEVSVGAGYGYFNGQSAAAFGAAMGLTNNWSVNAGAGISNADVSFRAGTNYKFKLF